MRQTAEPVTRAAVVHTLGTGRLARFAQTWPGQVPLQVFTAPLDPDPVRGCWLAHLRVLAAYDGPVAVFEDDAVFAPTFTLDVAWPADVDVGYLGGEHMLRPVPVGQGVVRARRVRRTHGYVAFDPARLAAMIGPPGGRHIDGRMMMLALKRYAVSPFTVGQAAGRSMVAGTVRPEAEWWNGPSRWSPSRAPRRPPRSGGGRS